MHARAHTHTHAHTHTQTHTRTHTHARKHACAHTHVQTNTQGERDIEGTAIDEIRHQSKRYKQIVQAVPLVKELYGVVTPPQEDRFWIRLGSHTLVDHCMMAPLQKYISSWLIYNSTPANSSSTTVRWITAHLKQSTGSWCAFQQGKG